MKYEVKNIGAYAVLSLSGEIDMNNSVDARRAMLECLEDRRGLIVDLSQVAYIDSSGVASLIEAYQMAKNNSMHFALVDLSSAVRRVLELAHLDRVFPIYDKADEAMEDDR